MLGAAPAQAQESTEYTVQEESKLWVDGTSSKSDWTVNASEVKGSFGIAGNGASVSSGKITVDAAKIESGKSIMDRLMHDAAVDQLLVKIVQRLVGQRLVLVEVLARGRQDVRIVGVGIEGVFVVARDVHPAPEDIEYYICGPPMMLQAVLKMLDNLGVEALTPLTVGPAGATEPIRKALAMGVAKAVHVADDQMKGSDMRATLDGIARSKTPRTWRMLRSEK